MNGDDSFEPRLGRIGDRGNGKKARRYLSRAIAATMLAGAGRRSRATFDGSRIGRGAGVGRVLGSRQAGGRAGGRRVAVKARLVRLAGKGVAGARAHLSYIRREGVTREGQPAVLYAGREDVADDKGFLERGAGDRHQFRFIVSPEDGDAYEDLKPLTRRLMAQVEQDLGTRLDWVAVDHFNTGHPHTHIMLRGVDEKGADLIIAREYIARGMRERAADLVALDLGPRTDVEIAARLRNEIGAERLTSIDRQLLRDMDVGHQVGSMARDPFSQSLRAGRLSTLKAMGLAQPLQGGRWQLAEGLEATLRAMGERGDIIRTLQRATARDRANIYGRGQRIYDPMRADAAPLIGRLVERGLADEHRDRHYLVIDGVDGAMHYVAIGNGVDVETFDRHAILSVKPARGSVRDVDRTIAAVAARHDGRYSVDLHLADDPGASEAYAQSHVRRLEAIRRLTGGATRNVDGSWAIAADHLVRVEAYEARIARDRPVTVAVLSAQPLETLVRADGPTWLDRIEQGDMAAQPVGAGFGSAVREALSARRQWMLDQGLAEQGSEGSFRLAANALATLRRRELLRVASQLSAELSLAYVETHPGERVEGRLGRRVDLLAGRYALVENGREFTLVPWRPALEKEIGRPVSGLLRADGMSWTYGRSRGGPALSGM